MSVVENQRATLRGLTDRGLAWGIDPTDRSPTELIEAIEEALRPVVTKEQSRQNISQNCLYSFDGRGARRAVDAMAEFI
jgi:UDP-N-acetylglucosamine:LPS N-acetylglucosamine transferase